MWFYLTLGTLFTIYALDLLWLVIIATIARSYDALHLARRYREEDPEAKVSCGCLPPPGASNRQLQQLQRQKSAAAAAAAAATAAVAGKAPPPSPATDAMTTSDDGICQSSSEGAEQDGKASHPLQDSHLKDKNSIKNDLTDPGPRVVVKAEGICSEVGEDGTLASDVQSGESEQSTVPVGRAPLPAAATVVDAAGGRVLASYPSCLDSSLSQASSNNGDGSAATGAAAAAAGSSTTALVLDADEADVFCIPSMPTDPRAWPKVLVQLPMYNEEAHADLIVQRCCKIRWPKDRLIIQVLDDSTRQEVRSKVDAAVLGLIEEGHPVQVLRRDNRQGYKAGAMVEGLAQLQGEGYEYAAIFDADFEPPEDFLLSTIPPLFNDAKLGFVQTRWLNPSSSFLTWVQRVNLDFHFDVEQRARSYLGWFFNFNGTAGVWRIAAIEDAGGWESDTVVEDMDLSLRCYLNGWTALYMHHVENPNELPSTLSTYKTQQFRWLSGPMQILVKCFLLIWRANKISFWKRLNCYWFFARYMIFAAITVGVLSVPPVVLWVDEWRWEGPQIFFMVAINFALAVYLYITPWSLPYLLFSVTIGYFKAHAMLSGLIGAEKSKKWKVTQKFGAGSGGFSWRNMHKPYTLELLLCMYYGGMGTACILVANWMLGGYCIIMAVLFLALSFGDYFF